jgi:enoyl-CoA hydratase
MPAIPALRIERQGGIAFIIADNPERMNAWTSDMWRALPSAISEVEGDPEVRVIVMRGTGSRAFSAGADISEFDTARSGANAAAYDQLNHDAFEALTKTSKPTIAMIHGFCLGGGLALALCCDLRMADEQSQFALPPAKLGIGYNARWIAPILAAVRPDRAKEMLFTGQRYKAEQALAMGLVTRICSTDALERETLLLAESMAANAPLSIRAAKQAINELARYPEHPDMARLDALVSACFESDDYKEGRRAFLEKRKPVFVGR